MKRSRLVSSQFGALPAQQVPARTSTSAARYKAISAVLEPSPTSSKYPTPPPPDQSQVRFRLPVYCTPDVVGEPPSLFLGKAFNTRVHDMGFPGVMTLLRASRLR